MNDRRLRIWGWGHENQTLTEAESRDIAARIGGLTDISPHGYTARPSLDEIRQDAVKVRLDPKGILNPGVIVPSRP